MTGEKQARWGPAGEQGDGHSGLVTVRYWAAARAAAGVPEESVPAATLAELVALLGDRHGPALARVLSYCSFVVDGTPAGGGRRERAGVIAPGEQAPPLPGVDLVPGAVVEVLPPFAGGSSDDPVVARGASSEARRPRSRDQRLVVVAAAVVAAALVAGALEWSRVTLAVALVLVQLALALGLALGVAGRLPDGRRLAVLPVLAGVVADGVLLGDRTRAAGVVAAVIGLAFVAALVQQLAWQPRLQVTVQLATVMAGVFVVTVLALALPLRELPDGVTAALATLAGAGVAVLVGQLIPVLPLASHALGVVAAAVAGALLARGGLSTVESSGVAAAAAAGAAVADLAVLRAAAQQVDEWSAAALAVSGVLPVAIAVPLGYLVAHWVAS